MIDHLPILQVVLPLIAAPFCVLLRRRGPALAFATGVAWVTLGISIGVLARVLRDGAWSYNLGGWAPPWGIEYRIDPLAAFVALFVSAMGAIVITYAPASLNREIPRDRHALFAAAYLLCLTGLLGITVTGDLFNVFVFLEISSLSSYAMIALGSDRRALTAALRYLILGTIGATFILIGIGFLYMLTGTLNMADMALRLEAAEGNRAEIVAFAFFTVGVCLKMALFPLHLWLPDAYTYSPSVVSAFLAATATKVSVYVLLRFVFGVYGTDFAFETMSLDMVLMPLALVGIFVASTVAVFQRNLKRMLAYSSVAQIGYIVLAISFASTAGLTAGILHMFNHALMKGGLFLATGCIVFRLGSSEIEDLRGVGRVMPVTMFAWVLGGLGLIGVPLTAGFVSKWYLLRAAFDRGLWPVAMLVLLSSLIAVVYVWRVVELAYFGKPSRELAGVREAPLSLLVPTCVVLALTLWFGLDADFPASVASAASAALLGSGP